MRRFPILDSRFTACGLLITLSACGATPPTEQGLEVSIRPEVALFLASAAPLVTVMEGRVNVTTAGAEVRCSPAAVSVAAAPSPAAPTAVERCVLWADLPETAELGASVAITVARESDGTKLAQIIGGRPAAGRSSRPITENAVLILLDDDSDGVPTLFELAAGFPPLDAGLKPGIKELESAANGAKRRLQPHLGALPPLSFDLNPPQASITRSDSPEESVNLRLGADEPVAAFLCSIDGSKFEVCSEDLSLKSVSEGPHQVLVKAVGGMGNTQAEPTAYRWVRKGPADLAAPTAPSSLRIDMSEWGDGRVALTWSAASDENGVAAYRIWYSTDLPGPPYDGKGLVEGNSPVYLLGRSTAVTLSGLKARGYTFSVTALDPSRNESGFSEAVNTFLPPAQVVLGQPDFNTATGGLSAATFYNRGADLVRGLAFDSTAQRLFVSDYYGNRVMVFSLSGGIRNGMEASNVLGAKDFTTRGAGCAPSSLINPTSAEFDPVGKRLFVPQEGASRVSVFELGGGITDGMNASYVLGQQHLSTCESGTTRSTLSETAAVSLSQTTNRVFVSDMGNNRVLVLDLRAGIKSGMDAAFVLGQSGFVTNSCGNGPGGMDGPRQTVYDDLTSRLFVADAGTICGMGSRVLLYDFSRGVENGMNASSVLGRPDFTTLSKGQAGRASLNSPRGIALDPAGRRLFVSDNGNHRVLMFDVTHDLHAGMEAFYVIGQPDFESRAPGTSQTRLRHPAGMAFDPAERRLFVADSGNNRVLVFKLPP